MIKTILLILTALISNSIASNQYFITQPKNTTEMAGTLVTLPCTVFNKQGVCQWTRDGLGLGVDIELAAYPRLTMSENSCDLQISPLLPSDEGVYQCQVGAKPGVAPIASRSASLIVTSEPGQPHITQAALGDVMEVKKGEEVLLECQSLGGKPAAEITWSDHMGKIINDEVITKIVPMEDGKTFKSISTLRFTPTTDTEISCLAKSDVFPVPKTSLIVIKHLQKPTVYLSMENPRIQVGDSFDIRCNTKAYPESVSYKWYINGQQLFNEKSSTLTINKIVKSFDKTEVKCKATNKVGSEKTTMILNVNYGPVIVKEPEDILAKPGEIATFTCLAKANPSPTYVWIRKSTREVVGFASSMTVTTNEKDEQFVCKVFSEGFEEVESTPVKLQVIRKPIIKNVDEGQIGGEHLLHCSVESVAKKTKISWIVNDNPIDISDDNYETIYNEDDIFHHSFLVFKHAERKVLEHACFVSNEAGTDYKVAQNMSGQIDTVAIVILVILLLIVIMFLSFTIIIYQRKKYLSVDRMEKEKQIQSLSTETQPCLERSFCLDQSFISPSHSFDSCNTLSTTLARSFSLDQSRTERRMGF